MNKNLLTKGSIALSSIALAGLALAGCAPTTQAEDAPVPTNISVELLGKNDVVPGEFKRVCADGLGFLVTVHDNPASSGIATGLVRVPEWDKKCSG